MARPSHAAESSGHKKRLAYETVNRASFLSPQTQVEIQRGCSRAAETLPFLNVYPMADRLYPLRDRGNNRSVSNHLALRIVVMVGRRSDGFAALWRPKFPQCAIGSKLSICPKCAIRQRSSLFAQCAIGSKLITCPKCAIRMKAHFSALRNRIKTRDMSGMRTRVSGPALLICAKR
jgi:hypothetical protein